MVILTHTRPLTVHDEEEDIPGAGELEGRQVRHVEHDWQAEGRRRAGRGGGEGREGGEGSEGDGGLGREARRTIREGTGESGTV